MCHTVDFFGKYFTFFQNTQSMTVWGGLEINCVGTPVDHFLPKSSKGSDPRKVFQKPEKTQSIDCVTQSWPLKEENKEGMVDSFFIFFF